MRLFIAIDVSDNLKDFFSIYNKSLNSIPGLRVVSPSKLHLTLDFIGDEDPKKIVAKLKKVKFKPFFLETDKFGFFPNKENIRVVWLGLKPSSNLQDLKNKVGKNTEFIPHITIARSNSLTSRSKNKLIKVLKRPDIKFKVTNFKLYNSELTPLGYIYTLLESFEAK
ncbi:MAG: RNA 2',3'-cyclic phosphodiesterase [Candidatus Woesearchaeota archaeon]